MSILGSDMEVFQNAILGYCLGLPGNVYTESEQYAVLRRHRWRK